ncbi:MAG: hypothetical protein SOZ00_06390 [Tidjanibacter sp.]|nr:hypothetical protein [Tidjanibacter sp.]
MGVSIGLDGYSHHKIVSKWLTTSLGDMAQLSYICSAGEMITERFDDNETTPKHICFSFQRA